MDPIMGRPRGHCYLDFLDSQCLGGYKRWMISFVLAPVLCKSEWSSMMTITASCELMCEM